MSVPRNLRKPTPRRVKHWWEDFANAWHGIGMMLYQLSPDEGDA